MTLLVDSEGNWTETLLKYIITLVKGFLIGIANIIPGVSGGTFALILGIFDRLVQAIKSLDLTLIKTALGALKSPFSAASKRALADEWKRTDATFLILIGLGAVISVVSCAWLMGYLLGNHPSETLAFFVGLIIPSIAVPFKMMEKRGPAQLFWVLPGAALTVWISLCDVGGGTGEPGFAIVLLGGVLAISAMILPGVSGSFCLLILGLYQPTLSHIKQLTHDPGMDAIIFISTLGLGCVLGLVVFSRLMAFMLERCRSQTLAFLIGLILGSFWVLWPVKDFDQGARVLDSKGEAKEDIAIATAPNRLPGDKDGDGMLCVRCMLALLAGAVGAAGVSRMGKLKED